MRGKGQVDLPTRRRIAAHVRRRFAALQAADPEYTQLDLARELGVQPSTVSRLLADKAAIGLDLVLAINRRLRIDADVLLNSDPLPPRTK
jgi:plasmid maintenance system antidote protein VapI